MTFIIIFILLSVVNKSNRLSFRIPNQINNQIERCIERMPNNIIDRSDFGTRAVIHYINYLTSQNYKKFKTLEIITKIADKLKITEPEIIRIKELLENEKFMNHIFEVKTEHLYYQQLIDIVGKMNNQNRQKYVEMIKNANYSEIYDLFCKAQETYFLEVVNNTGGKNNDDSKM